MFLLPYFILFLCVFSLSCIELCKAEDDSSMVIDRSDYPPITTWTYTTSKHNLFEVLHLDELFHVFKSIPHLQLFDDLRYAIGFNIGIAVYKGLTSHQRDTINSIFSISNSDQLGGKFAQCFDAAFFMNKNKNNDN